MTLAALFALEVVVLEAVIANGPISINGDCIIVAVDMFAVLASEEVLFIALFANMKTIRRFYRVFQITIIATVVAVEEPRVIAIFAVVVFIWADIRIIIINATSAAVTLSSTTLQIAASSLQTMVPITGG